MDRRDYVSKLNDILADETKFEKLSRDPTSKIKVKVNKMIDSANAVKDHVHFSKVTGEFAPGYAHGTVKVHNLKTH